MKNNNLCKPIIGATLLAFVNLSWSESKQPVVEPTQQELNAINQSDTGLEVKTHADGSSSIDLEGRFQMFSKAALVDGKVVYSCQGHEHDSTEAINHDDKENIVKRGVR